MLIFQGKLAGRYFGRVVKALIFPKIQIEKSMIVGSNPTSTFLFFSIFPPKIYNVIYYKVSSKKRKPAMHTNQWRHVRSNQINNSSSKSAYGFNKEERFRSLSKMLCDSFYNIPSTMGRNQASGIGKGSKLSFGDRNKFPPPNNYQIKSYFEHGAKGGKFALSRENVKYGAIPINKQTPEPGRYSSSNSKYGSSSYTMRKKLQPLQPSYLKAPGPGQYNSQATISPYGKYTLSQVSNCSVLKIKLTKPYDESRCRKTPGPGAYNQEKENMNSSGYFFNSKYEGSRCRSFSRSSRKDIVSSSKKKLPGPGTYNYFSQFGAR